MAAQLISEEFANALRDLLGESNDQSTTTQQRFRERPGLMRGANIQIALVTGDVVTESTGDITNFYPAKVQIYDAETRTFSDGQECYLAGLNNQLLSTRRFNVKCAGKYNDKPLYFTDEDSGTSDPGAGCINTDTLKFESTTCDPDTGEPVTKCTTIKLPFPVTVCKTDGACS